LKTAAELSARLAGPDALAGLAVWAVMVPESMAYAGIVGVPPIMGLYTIVPPLIAYALFGTSRVLGWRG
jgi:sulfate permease, SulP family